ncbi:chorismate mutase [Nioella sp. MMSF_3534]|jgi:isochorismate pyruvate lyase|uniref:chorismate mutase n=1 Tax=Nioella sp. MMSF_3534 TaxID=3046720 RepID=UPI00273FF6BF|nr:chorismate mutase [Nioella sp. MMSF_3534]
MTNRPAPGSVQTMAELRSCIDEIDEALLVLLAERQRYTDRAPELKAREGIAAAAPSRVRQVLDHVRARADAAGMDADLAESMWRIMIETVIAREERVIGKEGKDG